MKILKNAFVLAAVCAGLILAGCAQATGGSGGSTDGPITGKINNVSFTAAGATAAASEDVGGSFDVTLLSSGIFPVVTFTVLPEAHDYTVTTLGAGGGLAVIAAVDNSGSFIAFDSGTVKITKVSASVIEGTLSNVKTTDNESNISGTFSATIAVQ